MLTRRLGRVILFILFCYTWLRGSSQVRVLFTNKDFTHRIKDGENEWYFVCRQRQYDIRSSRVFRRRLVRTYIVEATKSTSGMYVGSATFCYPEMCTGLLRSTTLPHRLAITQAIVDLTNKPP